VIAVLVVLSVILTAAVLYPAISDAAILWTLSGGAVLAIIVCGIILLLRNGRSQEIGGSVDSHIDRAAWRMPPLAQLSPPRLTIAKRAWLAVLRLYLAVASIMVVVRVVQIALGQS
jgi:hypothetical protein